MVPTINTAPVCAVNENTITSIPNAVPDLDTPSRSNIVRPIQKMIVVFETSEGIVLAASRAPNLLKKELAGRYESLRLRAVQVPPDGTSADWALSQVKRTLRLKGPNGHHAIGWETAVRTLNYVFMQRRICEALSHRKSRVKRAVRMAVVRLLTV